MSILINRFNLRYALHQTNLSPDIADALTDKIAELLERDTAKNPYIFNSDSDSEARCKSCDGDVSDEYRFCPHCGQRLDWSE